MKTIGLCCCYRNCNYGSQLQSYATTVEMKKRGINCEVIRYKKKWTLKFMREAKLWTLPFNRVFLSDSFLAVKKKIFLELHKDFKQQNAVRNRRFEEFSQSRFTNLSKVCNGHDELKTLGASYDGVFVGSDQLWSPGGITGNFHNLMFVPDNVPKFSYAASIGVSKLPKSKRKLYTTFLNRIEHISMRENAGSKIVKELTGRDVPVVVDPVMLLTKEEWEKEIPVKKVVDEPYIFAYFLGKSKENRLKIMELKEKTGIKTVTFHHMDCYNKADIGFGDEVLYDVGPEEFVNLIRNAEYVCTDSFHGSVFSLIHHKKLMIFNRYTDSSKVSKNSRIDSLSENLGLEDRRFNGGNLFDVLNDMDYTSIDKRIEEMRAKSKQFLDTALAFCEE